jgi:hypothetical protein
MLQVMQLAGATDCAFIISRWFGTILLHGAFPESSATRRSPCCGHMAICPAEKDALKKSIFSRGRLSGDQMYRRAHGDM